MRSLAFAVLVAVAAVLAACSSNSGGPFIGIPTAKPSASPSKSPAASATVAFTFVVPTPAPSLRKRNVVLPSSSESVKITLDSVNTSPAPSSSPTTANLSTTTSGCTNTTPVSCTVNVGAPVGALVYTVTVYAAQNESGSPLGEGNLAVTTTAGTTATVPTTMSGTVAKIIITMGGAAELGVSANIPVVIQGEDANGYTILGTYTNPIALSDSDTSGTTSLSTENLPDSTTAANVTLSYSGGSLSTPATIGATASGVTASSITTAAFSPDATIPEVASSAQFSQTFTETSWTVGQPTGSPFSSTTTTTASIETSPSPLPSATPFSEYSSIYDDIFSMLVPDSDPSYYTWTSSAGTQQLLDLGYYQELSTGNANVQYCSPPTIAFEIPIPASWNALPANGQCTLFAQFTSPATGYKQWVVQNNGSYTFSFSYGSGEGSGTWTIDPSGDVTVDNSDPDLVSYYPSFWLSAPAPTTPNSATVTASYVAPTAGPLASPLPAPTTTTAPNPWLSMPSSLGLNGMPPNPLQSDVFNNAGTITPSELPSSCPVSSTIIPSNATLTHIQEVYYDSDPAYQYGFNYASGTTDYYYLAGVGVVCVAQSETGYFFGGSVVDWYDGTNQSMEGATFTITDYMKSTSLTATLAHARSMTAAASQASALLLTVSHEQRNTLIRRFMTTYHKQVNEKLLGTGGATQH